MYSTLDEQSVSFRCDRRSDRTEVLREVGEVVLSNQCELSTKDIFCYY